MAEQTQTGFVRGLGLFDATMIVAGSMIGSGIFIVSADIVHQVRSPGLLLLVWLLSGLMTLIGALSFGELAAMMPQAGGQYVYLREALGPACGFLYGWTMLLVIQTATIAAVCIAFGKYTAVIVPWFDASRWIWKIGTFGPWHFFFGVLGPYNVGLNRQNLLSVIVIVFLTWVNTRGLSLGKIVQNIFTVAKIASLAGIVLLGLFFSTEIARHTNFTDFWRNGGLSLMHSYPPDNPQWMIGTLTLIGVAMVGSLFSMDAWGCVTFTSSEIRNPGRNLPLSLAFGTGLVVLLYTLANVAYLRVLPAAGDPNGATIVSRGIEYAADGRVATAVTNIAFGPAGAILMAIAILVSTFGCGNGLILSGARIYYAMSKDGLFFRSVGNLNAKHVPALALILQGIWAGLLCLTGTYSQLLDAVIFAELIFYILTLAALFILRWKRPCAERPYRAFGYPVLPILYFLMAGFLLVQLLRYKPQYTWPGLFIVLLGVPVYMLRARAAKSVMQVATAPAGEPAKPKRIGF